MYKEVNPAVFACISFPFLFGVMFGDMGHGLLLFLLGLGLVLGNERMKGTSMEAAGQARYIIFLMGFFAFFNGLIYNECFSMPLDLFGSCYEAHAKQLFGNGTTEGYRRTSFDCVYPVGVDPRWA
jgi:V-type H+-transporting ATPase subunit a